MSYTPTVSTLRASGETSSYQAGMSTPRPSLAEIHQMAQEMARKTTATWALKVYLWFAVSLNHLQPLL